MYRACIYCHRDLGGNEVVENFPVGRRLAFDSDKGRLWVICDACRRWNLSPLEERWEAIEECEKGFRDCSSRFSTDNVGLARLQEGLELVRIGRPQRPEFAAWRYGTQFLKRRIRNIIKTGIEVAISIGGLALGADIFWVFIYDRRRRVVAQVRSQAGERLQLTSDDVKQAKLIQAGTPEGWALHFPYRRPRKNRSWWWPFAGGKKSREEIELTGPSAVRAAGKILPKVNSYGGTNNQVDAGVKLIEQVGGPERLFAMRSVAAGELRADRFFDVEASRISKMDAEVRLALEMAAHEESERRALAGELALLEDDWREAEEIAAIADRLLIPERIEEWIRREKGGER